MPNDNPRRARTGRASIFGAAFLFSAAGLVSACQTTTQSDQMADDYTAALACIRAHVDHRLTAATEPESEIGELVRAGINSCEGPVKAYIQRVNQYVMDRKRWTWMGEDSREAITEEVIVTTSLMLQQEYNEKERKQ